MNLAASPFWLIGPLRFIGKALAFALPRAIRIETLGYPGIRLAGSVRHHLVEYPAIRLAGYPDTQLFGYAA